MSKTLLPYIEDARHVYSHIRPKLGHDPDSYEKLHALLKQTQILMWSWWQRTQHPFTQHLSFQNYKPADVSNLETYLRNTDLLGPLKGRADVSLAQKKAQVSQTKFCQSSIWLYDIFTSEADFMRTFTLVTSSVDYVQDMLIHLFVQAFPDKWALGIPFLVWRRIWEYHQFNISKGRTCHTSSAPSIRALEASFRKLENQRIQDVIVVAYFIHTMLYEIMFMFPDTLEVFANQWSGEVDYVTRGRFLFLEFIHHLFAKMARLSDLEWLPQIGSFPKLGVHPFEASQLSQDAFLRKVRRGEWLGHEVTFDPSVFVTRNAFANDESFLSDDGSPLIAFATEYWTDMIDLVQHSLFFIWNYNDHKLEGTIVTDFAYTGDHHFRCPDLNECDYLPPRHQQPAPIPKPGIKISLSGQGFAVLFPPAQNSICWNLKIWQLPKQGGMSARMNKLHSSSIRLEQDSVVLDFCSVPPSSFLLHVTCPLLSGSCLVIYDVVRSVIREQIRFDHRYWSPKVLRVKGQLVLLQSHWGDETVEVILTPSETCITKFPCHLLVRLQDPGPGKLLHKWNWIDWCRDSGCTNCVKSCLPSINCLYKAQFSIKPDCNRIVVFKADWSYYKVITMTDQGSPMSLYEGSLTLYDTIWLHSQIVFWDDLILGLELGGLSHVDLKAKAKYPILFIFKPRANKELPSAGSRNPRQLSHGIRKFFRICVDQDEGKSSWSWSFIRVNLSSQTVAIRVEEKLYYSLDFSKEGSQVALEEALHLDKP